MRHDFRSDTRIVPVTLVTTGRGRQGLVERIFLLLFRYATARRAESTKSEGQALRVSLVKPGAYLSESYLDYLESGSSEQSSACVSLHKMRMTRHVSARFHAQSPGNLGENPLLCS